MIAYVDTSTLIKLLVEESGSDSAAQIWLAADSLVSVSLIEVEARAALAAATRAGRLTAAQHARATVTLSEMLAQLALVDVTAELITAASALAETEALHGYDAVHLAAALFVEADVLTSADLDLCAAATRRGLNVATPT